MRKISKSRTEEDVISSTNGSVNNEVVSSEFPEDDPTSDREDLPQPSANGDESDAAAAADPTDDDDEPLKKTPAKRGRPKKAAKKSKSSTKEAKNDKHKDDDDDDEEEEEQEYEVEKVIDSKKIKGKLHYLVRWKGYSASSDTWEPEDTVSCPELIAKFEKDNSSKKPAPASKKKAAKRKTKAELKSPAKKPRKPAQNDWDSENADENEEYEVERILEVHHKKNGKRDFLIHWKGWSNKYDSWEPEEHLNCADLIQKFMDKVDSAKSSESKNLRVAPGSTKRFTLQAPSSGRRLSKRRGQKQRVRYDDAE